ncbi:MAG: DUF4265 domain-containing protein [Pseudomonadales bacterium]|nr:DUF4265 domain-containing protein [Pseudomonadales bacterium]
MSETTEVAFFAGLGADEQPVFESLQVEIVDPSAQTVRILKSPLLIRDLASGDVIELKNPATGDFEMQRRSGNLSVRVFRMEDLEELAQYLVPVMEKLGGQLDLQTERGLSFSIHFSIGFKQIEEQLNRACTRFSESVWYYGNVYDPKDGVTALNWWLEFENLE